VIRVTAWQTDEPCPTCGAGLVLLDDGSPDVLWECRMCGDRPARPDEDEDEPTGGDW